MSVLITRSSFSILFLPPNVKSLLGRGKKKSICFKPKSSAGLFSCPRHDPGQWVSHDPKRRWTPQPKRKLPDFSPASEALLIQTVAFGAKNMQQKERNINKAKCHQCLPTYRHHPFVCSEMTSGPFGKYNGIHTTVLSSCSANDITSEAFPFNLKRGMGRRGRMPKEFGRRPPSKEAASSSKVGTRQGLGRGQGRACPGDAGFGRRPEGTAPTLCSQL